ncbi:unnamed protein product, partial [marine sediment metagenome]
SYTLLVDDDADFSSPVVSVSGYPATSYAVLGALALGTTYYWKVTASNASGSTEATGGSFTFVTIAELPPPLDYLGGGCAPGATDRVALGSALCALVLVLASRLRRG